MTMMIERFEANILDKGIKFTVDGNSVVTIKDHKTDKIIGMINLSKVADKNIELAEKIIETIEEFIDTNEQN